MNPPKSMTLSKLKQSELKRIFLPLYLEVDGKIVFDLENKVSSTIEKAFALGKEEKRKKITKKQVLDWLFDHDRNIYYQLLKSK